MSTCLNLNADNNERVKHVRLLRIQTRNAFKKEENVHSPLH